MKRLTLHPGLGLPYLGGAVLVTLLILLLSGITIWQEARRYRDLAEISTQNTTFMLSQHIEDTFQKADGLLQTVIYAHKNQHAYGQFNPEHFNRFLEHLRSTAHEVMAIRVLDAQGVARFGTGAELAPENFSDRDYFRRLRDLPSGSARSPMIFSGPLLGRLSKQWVLVLARRLENADGTFAGVVYLNMDNRVFGEMFSSLKLGPTGTIVLRTEDMAQVDRFPRGANPDADVGNRKVSQTLLELVNQWPQGHTYVATTNYDNVTRYYTYLKVGPYPFYIIAGEATQDFWISKRTTIAIALGFSALMILLTWLGFWRIFRLTQRGMRERADQQASMIMEVSPLATMVLREGGLIVKANQAAHQLFGYAPGQLLGHYVRDLVAPQSQDTRESIKQAFWGNRWEFNQKVEMFGLRWDGTEFPFQLSASAIELDNTSHMIVMLEDLTERKRADTQLRELLEFQKAILDHSTYGILTTTPQGVVTSFNPAAEQMLGYRSGELLGKYLPVIFRDQQTGEPSSPEKPEGGVVSYFDGLIAQVRQHGPQTREITCRRKDGSEFIGSRSASLLVNERGQATGILVFLVDITELKQAHDRLAHLAHYDALTNLPNRVLFFERMDQGLALARRNQTHAALLFLDLDKFKPVNDTWGHAMGDRLLTEVGRRITTCVRDSDSVGRIGGDEFVVFLTEVQSLEAALGVAEKIRFALSRPFHIDDKVLTIGCCMGVALYPEHGTNPTELAKSADTAMYHAKAGGLEKLAVFRPEMLSD